MKYNPSTLTKFGAVLGMILWICWSFGLITMIFSIPMFKRCKKLFDGELEPSKKNSTGWIDFFLGDLIGGICILVGKYE